ncbi:hypothetical protein [Natrinema thermotolerans]|uniref:hypothetical protein n=1 Tax=Natrinema thermotolerans TaxID=121872 RepID=UPI0006791E4F|nr:hypothetical protein [Natrinema thermotolerans]QCC57367.1 hypothetical protein DVR14_01410 [Natrinema thermotolerans]
MSVELDTPGQTIRLWNGQESRTQTQGNVKVDNLPASGSDKTLLTGLEASETVTYTGTATANRLSKLSGYSNDPETALAEWLVTAEATLNGRQGEGHDLVDDNRGRTIRGVLGVFGWQRSRGARYEVEWNLELVRGRGLMPYRSPSPPDPNPQEKAFLDGADLGSIRELQETKEQPIEPVPLHALSGPENYEILDDGGAQRSITITGEIAGDRLDTFDDHMRSIVGRDQIVTFEEAFPGRSLEVMVQNYDSVRSAGRTRLGSYSLEMVEGRSA